MKRISLEISEDAYMKLLEMQYERKMKKIEPAAINKIATEILENSLKHKKPAK